MYILSAATLLRMADGYKITPYVESRKVEADLAEGLSAVVQDALFQDIDVSSSEITQVCRRFPELVKTMLRLYAAYKDNGHSSL